MSEKVPCHGDARHRGVLKRSRRGQAQSECLHDLRDDKTDRVSRHREHREHDVRQSPENLGVHGTTAFMRSAATLKRSSPPGLVAVTIADIASKSTSKRADCSPSRHSIEIVWSGPGSRRNSPANAGCVLRNRIKSKSPETTGRVMAASISRWL